MQTQLLYFVNDTTRASSDIYDNYDGSLIAMCSDWSHVRQVLELRGQIAKIQVNGEAPVIFNEDNLWPEPPQGGESYYFWVYDGKTYSIETFAVVAQSPWQPGEELWLCKPFFGSEG